MFNSEDVAEFLKCHNAPPELCQTKPTPRTDEINFYRICCLAIAFDGTATGFVNGTANIADDCAEHGMPLENDISFLIITNMILSIFKLSRPSWGVKSQSLD